MSHYRRSLTPGASYFITVALADRHCDMLITHIDLLRQSYRTVAGRYPFETVAICILPDHLHAIWTLPMGDADFSTRWQLIKSGFSRHLPTSDGRSASKAVKREKGIWQRRFWEHQIRDDDDMQNHVEYIHYNPVTAWSARFAIGRTAAFTAMSAMELIRQTGRGISSNEEAMVNGYEPAWAHCALPTLQSRQYNRRVGRFHLSTQSDGGHAALCPPYAG